MEMIENEPFKSQVEICKEDWIGLEFEIHWIQLNHFKAVNHT